MLDTEFVSTNLDASNRELFLQSGHQRSESKSVTTRGALGGNLSCPPPASGGSACLGFELHGFRLPVLGLQEAPLLCFCGFVKEVGACPGLGGFHLEFHYYMVCVNVFEK